MMAIFMWITVSALGVVLYGVNKMHNDIETLKNQIHYLNNKMKDRGI